MVAGKSGKDLLNQIMHFFKGLGRPKGDLILRSRSGGSSSEDTLIPVSNETEAEKLTRKTSNRAHPGNDKTAPAKDQWQKLKESAKANDPGESNLDHWNQKHGSILSGTTFDAATTDISNGARPRKRPSVVTQARITSNRLQALQARMEKPCNDVDNKQGEESD